jgi:DNA-binding transcriptional LysR family regulator
VFSMAIGNVGVAVLPSSIRALKTNLTVRPIAIEGRPVEFEISAIWSRSTPLPAYGRRFVDALAAHIAREQDGNSGAAAVA